MGDCWSWFFECLFYFFEYDYFSPYIPTCCYFLVSILLYGKIKMQFASYNLGVYCEVIHFYHFVSFVCSSTVDRPSSSAITTIPSNYTVLRGSNVSFTCTTDANPPANMYHFYFKGSLLESSSSGVFNRTVEDDGLFTCVPINTVGTGDNATVNVTVVGESVNRPQMH